MKMYRSVTLLLSLSVPSFAQTQIYFQRDATKRQNINVSGDSLSGCYTAATGACGTAPTGAGPTTAYKRWPELLQAQFDALGWGGGRGFTGISVSNGGALNSEFWSTSTAFTEAPNVFGPSQSGYIANGSLVVTLPAGATATFDAKKAYAILGVWCANTAGANTVGWQVSFDGQPPVPGSACMNNGYMGPGGGDIVSFYAPTGLANHTATLTCPSSGVGPCYLAGASGWTGTTGVVVNNLSAGGNVADAFSTATKRGFFDLPVIGSHDLSISFLGTNDAANNVAVSTYGAQLGSLIASEQGHGASFLVIGAPPIGSSASIDASLSSYRTEAHNQANSHSAAYMDFSVWGTFSQAQGYYDQDAIHLNDSGQSWLANQVINAIHLPSGGNTNPGGGTNPGGSTMSVVQGAATYSSLPSTCTAGDLFFVSTGVFDRAVCQGSSWTWFYHGEPITPANQLGIVGALGTPGSVDSSKGYERLYQAAAGIVTRKWAAPTGNFVQTVELIGGGLFYPDHQKFWYVGLGDDANNSIGVACGNFSSVSPAPRCGLYSISNTGTMTSYGDFQGLGAISGEVAVRLAVTSGVAQFDLCARNNACESVAGSIAPSGFGIADFSRMFYGNSAAEHFGNDVLFVGTH